MMKSKFVDTLTSNEEHVRLEIFEGRISLDKAGEELLALYKAQLDRARQQVVELKIELAYARQEIVELSSGKVIGWPAHMG